MKFYAYEIQNDNLMNVNLYSFKISQMNGTYYWKSIAYYNTDHGYINCKLSERNRVFVELGKRKKKKNMILIVQRNKRLFGTQNYTFFIFINIFFPWNVCLYVHTCFEM